MLRNNADVHISSLGYLCFKIQQRVRQQELCLKSEFGFFQFL